MTTDCNQDIGSGHLGGGPPRRGALPIRYVAAALLGVAILVAGCDGSNSHGATGSGTTTNQASMAQGVAYARCMRSHGVSDFPDPNPGGGFVLNGGPGSAVNQNTPTFYAADQACRSLLPGGASPTPVHTQKLAAEVKWAQCLRSHGVPTFPDPNARGAFDSSRFDDQSPVFQAASQACKSLEPNGAIGAVPGSGPG